MGECVNLRRRFGGTYRVTFDPAYDPKGRRPPDPWYMLIVGKRGVVYPYTADLLAVECDHRPRTAQKLAALGLRLVQDGDLEKTFAFPPEQFEAVAALILPRKRRVLTPEQRAERAARLAAHRFPPSARK